MLDYKPFTDISKDNFSEHLVSNIDASHIEHVISNGKLIVKNKMINEVDEKIIKAEAQKLSKYLWNKMF